MNIFDTSAEFLQDAASKVSETFLSRKNEIDYSVDYLAKTAQGLGYLVSNDVARHDNLEQSREVRNYEIEELNRDYAAPATTGLSLTNETRQAEVEELEADFTAPAIEDANRTHIQQPVSDELVERRRREDEARRMTEEAHRRTA